MPATEDILQGFLVLLIIGAVGLGLVHGFYPENRVSRGLKAFWNTPSIKKFRMFIWAAFWFCFLGMLAIGGIEYYFTDSGWYPQQREVEVFFKAHEWIDGEIQTCYSGQFATEENPAVEVKVISCSFEQNESHMLRVKFGGPIRADKNKVWRCERSQATMTCRLQ